MLVQQSTADHCTSTASAVDPEKNYGQIIPAIITKTSNKPGTPVLNKPRSLTMDKDMVVDDPLVQIKRSPPTS